MSTLLGLLAQVGSADEGLTFSELIDSLPTDPASIFVLVVTGFAVAVVFWTGRPRGKGGGPR
jgi:hypothetical protein